jgi:hypothetical protein
MFFCHYSSPYVSMANKEQNPNQRNANNPVERSAEKHAGMYPICITLGGVVSRKQDNEINCCPRSWRYGYAVFQAVGSEPK